MAPHPHSPPLLPTFIIGGAARSGTTLLATLLDGHPHIAMAKPLIPEPKVFTLPASGGDAYLARYGAYFTPADAGKARGEKSTLYFESERACALIAQHLPEVRLIFLLRDPAARAYSNWLWSTKNGLETLGFEEAISFKGERASPLPPEKSYARPYDYIARGEYDRFAARYIAALGRERVAFFLYEALTDPGNDTLAECQDFIGVPRVLSAGRELPLINSARETGPAIRAETAERLRDRFRPSVERFSALTGIDCSRWGY